MNNQNTLIRRKEYFGLVWLAAHHPSKINKNDIIKMDLSAKCKQLSEYITNGNAKRPKFSLLVLSHLMYGLVVILNKKNVYLYNELVTLRGMLNVTYTIDLKEKTRTSKKSENSGQKIDHAERSDAGSVQRVFSGNHGIRQRTRVDESE